MVNCILLNCEPEKVSSMKLYLLGFKSHAKHNDPVYTHPIPVGLSRHNTQLLCISKMFFLILPILVFGLIFLPLVTGGVRMGRSHPNHHSSTSPAPELFGPKGKSIDV